MYGRNSRKFSKFIPHLRHHYRPVKVLCDLERSRRHTVTLGTRAKAVPLFHWSALGAQQSTPMRGFLRSGGELTNHNATNEIVATLHVVPKH